MSTTTRLDGIDATARLSTGDVCLFLGFAQASASRQADLDSLEQLLSFYLRATLPRGMSPRGRVWPSFNVYGLPPGWMSNGATAKAPGPERIAAVAEVISMALPGLGKPQALLAAVLADRIGLDECPSPRTAAARYGSSWKRRREGSHCWPHKDFEALVQNGMRPHFYGGVAAWWLLRPGQQDAFGTEPPWPLSPHIEPTEPTS